MANDILTQSGSEAPPIGTVLFWLTTTVERDFVQRAVFPMLRYGFAESYRASSSLHYLTEDQAQAVLADAQQREPQVCKGLRTAYRGHIKALQAAISEAVERPSVFVASEPICTYRAAHWERWQGTKEQLLAHGIKRDGPWPGEPGGKEHHCGARDARGYKTSIRRYSTIWPGIFVASIEIPYAIRAQEHNQLANDEKAKKARLNLAVMPKSIEDFRSKVIEEVRRNVRFKIEWCSQRSDYHGFRLADEVMEQVDEALDGIIEILSNAQIVFDTALQDEVERRYRSELASTDAAFQSKMADLVKPNPAVLGGGVR